MVRNLTKNNRMYFKVSYGISKVYRDLIFYP